MFSPGGGRDIIRRTTRRAESAEKSGEFAASLLNSVMSFIDSYDVLLLDMNGTFMFGHDRFGPDEDFFATYEALGGSRLDREQLSALFEKAFVELMAVYNSPERFDDFPSLAEAFRAFGSASDEDIPYLERVFAVHELGYVPAAHESTLRDLSTTHKLGVVSNICSHPALWLPSFRQVAVFNYFTSLTFSSDGRSIKPSQALFRRALADFPANSRVAFVGDNVERDIVPAKALGLGTIWIAPPGSVHPSADRVVESLTEVMHLP